MTVEEFVDEVEAAGRQFAFIGVVTKLDETRFSVKYRLVVTDDLYVQAYANTQNGTIAWL